MTDGDKLHKLGQNLIQKMGIEPEEGFLSLNIEEGSPKKISVRRHLVNVNKGIPNSYKQIGMIEENFNSGWTLEHWKQFRDRCLIALK